MRELEPGPEPMKTTASLGVLQLPWGSSSFPGGPVVKNLSCSAKHLVLSLVREEPTCLGAAKPVCHNY